MAILESCFGRTAQREPEVDDRSTAFFLYFLIGAYYLVYSVNDITVNRFYKNDNGDNNWKSDTLLKPS